MKQAKIEQRIEDSLLQLLLPVSRLLVHAGIGIDEFIHAAKGAYLRGAMQAVAQQDGRVNISRLSVATGMTRKEVAALLNEAASHGGRVARRSGQQRALRVLRGWLSDPRFHKPDGSPDELKYRGGKKSFVLLVRLYGGDVTPQTVLRELERMEVLRVMESGTLRLRTSRSRATTKVHYKLADLARLFEDFALAAVGPGLDLKTPSFLAFKDTAVSSTADAAYFMRRFSRRAAAFLEDFEQWAVGRKSMRSLSRQNPKGIRLGLGVYLLRADQLSGPNGIGHPATRPRLQPTEKRQLRKPSRP